jgi:septum formation protein
LLDQIGVRYRIQAAALDERQRLGETPAACVQRLALAKAEHILEREPAQGRVVLGADTAVVIEGQMLGKPEDRADHQRMMRALSGQVHEVLTAVAVVSSGRASLYLSENQVGLIELSAEDIAAYWASGEPADKAGGYAIQGRGALFVASLRGSYSAVMGLPLCESALLLKEHGVVPDWKERA